MKTRNSVTGANAAANNAKQGRCRRSIHRGSKKVSLTRKMEKLAEEVTTEFSTACVKLRELKPRIEKIRSYFRENIRGSVTLSGCRSFREFCENRLHRSQQAVYRLLSSDSKKSQSQKKTRVPPTTHRKRRIANPDTERLHAACLAAARHFDAEDTGNTPEASKAKEEFFAIVHSLRFFETGGAGHGRQRSLYRDAERERQRQDRATSTAPISSSTPPPLSSPPLLNVGGTLNSSQLDYAVSS